MDLDSFLVSLYVLTDDWWAATPKDNSRRAWPEADRRWAAGKRQIIEGVIWDFPKHSPAFVYVEC